MDALTIIFAVIAAIASICAIIFGFVAASRNKAKDNSAEGVQTGTILTELGYIKANTDEIKSEQKEQRKINTEMYSRMAAVEGSVKQAHKRLDEFCGRARSD